MSKHAISPNRAMYPFDLEDTKSVDARVVAEFIIAATGWKNLQARHYFMEKKLSPEDMEILLIAARHWKTSSQQMAMKQYQQFMERGKANKVEQRPASRR